jgi:hypothetical protein
MKTKLLGVAAACALALTVSTANATTYTINGSDFTSYTAACDFAPKHCSFYYNQTGDLGGTITGTVEIDNGMLVGADVSAAPTYGVSTNAYGTISTLLLFQYPAPPPRPQPPQLSFTSADQWSLNIFTVNFVYVELSFADNAGSLADVSLIERIDDPSFPDYYNSGATGTVCRIEEPVCLTTPIPPALPLFASGLAGLSLLGWRRKKKALAA